MKHSKESALKLLVDTVQHLSLARDLESVMKIVRTVARQLTGADGATFVLRDRDLCFYADEDAISPLWKGNRFPMSICISGWAMLNKRPAVIEDIYVDSRIPHAAYRPTFVKSLAMVPIRTIEPIGAIGNYWADQHMPTEDEINLLQSLADITAVTMENVSVYQQLEQRVKDRTEQLEAVNKELEAFSYSVSHDLRAPLRAITGYSEILREENFSDLNDTGKSALATIENSAHRMNSLIDGLLHFARAGKKPIEKIEINSDGLVKSVIDELTKSEYEKPEFKISELHPVKADEFLLRQVWTNLISNAIKYSSKKDSPVVEIGSYKNKTETVYVIKDNGTGFDMNYADKLFTTFQRLHRATDFPGNGVGLALSNRIITRHGGRMWAAASPNEGATFYFSLPLE
jgi:signal transduction histidine kinase